MDQHHLTEKLYNQDGSLNQEVENQLRHVYLIEELHKQFGTEDQHELVTKLQDLVDEMRKAMMTDPGEIAPEAYAATENLERILAKIH